MKSATAMRRSAYPLPRQAKPCADFPVLPGSMQRSQVGDLLREVRAALGLSSPALETLLKIIDMTRPRDWTDPAVEPVCYAAQTRLAKELVRTTRQVRSHERRLIELGLIGDRRKANGSRSRHGQCGLVLSSLIVRIPEFLDLRERLRADHERFEYLVSRRSALYRRAKAQILELTSALPADNQLLAIVDEFGHWPRCDRLRALPLTTLEEHIRNARDLVGRLDDLAGLSAHTSGRAEQDFRSYIQATKEETSVICSARALQRLVGQPDHDPSSGLPSTSADGLEPGRAAADGLRRPAWLARLSPERLRALASPDMQLYIDIEYRPRPKPRISDFTMAALSRVPELAISPSAWEDAVDQMGDVAATLCVLIIDANRSHPVTPIRRPGGALRAMTRRHAKGSLNLFGSLAGLMDRCSP